MLNKRLSDLGRISVDWVTRVPRRAPVSLALALVLSACVTGPDAETRFQKAVGWHKSGQTSRAVSEFQKLADMDHAGAQYHLGKIQEYGTGGLSQNVIRAAKLYAKSARLGNALAQDTLGHMHLYGTGVAKDEFEAAHWLTLAADQGLATSQRTLAELYARGEQIDQNVVKAYKWYSLAARKLDGIELEAVLFDRDILKNFMTAAELTKAEKSVRAWRPKFNN